ncbi:TadE family type IV pilus minor pilin [Bifidobacterium tsurumiense]|uniref:TadE family protein n=1 Tax=Bifidobacterium tsurumiense TaxID=356829 RepID=A0A087E932_9BIFI|nr:TadE family type IV pilus minor pilin [Bifidobacterium tsurumiense]KFJ04283.1 TadE family protein [Bifidobacterium tsurumiense]MDY4678601.1 TadE family type IV pilus minor pilin [Bifidobacterium tsurumiense]MSS12581.1 pilus assembly protein [Bifidobacterium tsurumiense]
MKVTSKAVDSVSAVVRKCSQYCFATKHSIWFKADAGSATAEFSIVLPAVLVVAAVLLSLCRAVVVTMDCQDAASAAARAMMLSADQQEARMAARTTAGEHVQVSITDVGNRYEVLVKCTAMPGPLHVIPAMVEAHAAVVKQ